MKIFAKNTSDAERTNQLLWALVILTTMELSLWAFLLLSSLAS